MRNTTHKSKRTIKSVSLFESLEGRQMHSASTPAGYEAYASGRRLEILTSGTHEQITVSQANKRILITDAAGTQSYKGKFRAIDIAAGGDTVVIDPTVTTPAVLESYDGDNTLITASRGDTLIAGDGNDDLVAISGNKNVLIGGDGTGNIWTTRANKVIASNTTLVHTVNSFIDTSETKFHPSPIGQPKADTDPSAGTVASYFDVSGKPLFASDGPSMDDIKQGAAGDCYFVSSLSAVAMQSPQTLRDMITPMGDGTFAVEFDNNGVNSYVREDGFMPLTDQNQMLYCDTGHEDSTWAPLIEKAWAYERPMLQGQVQSYAAAESGEGEEGVLALGGRNVDFNDDPAGQFSTGTDELDWIDQHLQTGDAVVIGTNDIGLSNVVITDHEYTAVNVTRDRNGVVTGVWLRNPWGVDVDNGIAADGHNDGENDGYVFVTADELYGVCNNVAAGTFA